MNRVMTYAVSVLAIGLSAPACAAVSANHGLSASAASDTLSAIATTFDASGSNPASVGSSAHDDGVGSVMGDSASSDDSMPLGDSTSADNSSGSGETPGPAQRDNTPSSPDHGHSSGATPHGKRSTLTWQSLIPGSLQQ